MELKTTLFLCQGLGTILYIILCVVVLSHAEYVEWIPSTNTQITSLPGQDVVIRWINQNRPDFDATTILKNNISIATYVKNDVVMMIDDERYHLQKTENETIQEITLTINNVNVEDSGIFRCYIDILEEYKDIQLNVTIGVAWLKRRNPVKSTLRQDVELLWETESQKSIHRIEITRYDNNTNQVENIGVWTLGNGFVVDISLSTPVELNLRGGEITLKIVRAIYKDFDKIYRCQVHYGKSFSEISEIQLIAERPAVTSAYFVTKDDLKLIWNYTYNFPVVAIIMSRTRSDQEELGYWYQGVFKPAIHNKTFVLADDFIDKNITLTVLNAMRDDFNVTYNCEIIFGDGEKITSNLVPYTNGNITPTEQPPPVSNKDAVKGSDVWIIGPTLAALVVLL